METFEKLIEELEQEEIQDALRMTDTQKFRAGGDLFEYACSITLAGIMSDHPDFTPEQALDELRRRIALHDEVEIMQ